MAVDPTPQSAAGAPHSPNPKLTAAQLIAWARRLAERARRLPSPSHRRPEAFLEAKDELADELRRLADQVAADFR